jgi:hypothetical protein
MQVKETTVTVDEVGPILEVIDGGKTYLRQLLYVTEQAQRPNQFEIEIWNSAIAKFNLSAFSLTGRRCRIKTYLNGRRIDRGGIITYQKTITLNSIQRIKEDTL